MAESENSEGKVRRSARVLGRLAGSNCDGLAYTQAAEKAFREELERTSGKFSKECVKTLIWLPGNPFEAMVEVQDYLDGPDRIPSGPPCIVKVTVSLKFEFSARQPGANG